MLRAYEWARFTAPEQEWASFLERPCPCGTADCDIKHCILGWNLRFLPEPKATLESFIFTAVKGVPPRGHQSSGAPQPFHAREAFRASMYFAALVEGERLPSGTRTMNRLRPLEVLVRTKRLNPAMRRNDDIRDFCTRLPRLVPIGEGVRVKLVLVRRCRSDGCGNWVPEGDKECSFCLGEAPRGAPSKAWEITEFGLVSLNELEAVLKKCSLGQEDAASESGEIANKEACE
jgi:hypothetical protein